jgi:uncharacterized membrane protein YgcG
MKLLVIISALIVCMNLSAQKEKTFTSKWLDSSAGTFVPAASDYVAAKKGMVLYCLANDDKNIYVDIKITESIEQNKVLQMGLVLWVNADGKSRKITGIRYPIGAKYSRLQVRQGAGQENSILNKVSPLSQANTIELIGFKDIEARRFPSNLPENIRGSVKYDNDGNLLYSLTIPLSKLPVGAKSINEGTSLMTFAIEYGAPPSIGAQQGRPSDSGAPSGGGGRSGGRSGGGSRGGSMGGGAPGGGGPTTQDIPVPVIIWIKDIKLAEKK